MKNFIKSASALIILIAFTLQGTASDGFLKIKKDPQNYITITGKVVDQDSNTPLIFATVAVQSSNVATVTNIEGEFILKIDVNLKNPVLEVMYIGYNNKIIPLSELKTGGRDNTISLEQAVIPIAEVVIKPILPEEIIANLIYNIKNNYTDVPNQMTSFYRETIKRNRSYVSIAEAVVEVFKAPYNNEFRFDLAKVYKGRKNVEINRLDTVLFKLQGGPVTTLQLDLVKNSSALLSTEEMESYDYILDNIVSINEKPHYVVSFRQKANVDIPLFLGRLFIDMETFALTEAEFSINLEDEDKASSIFIRKKPLGMKVTPEMASYRVKFREQDGKWYFGYGRAEVKFKVNWAKKLFNTSYTTMSEIAITDRTEEEVVKFTGKERLRKGDIFTEELAAFADPDFWGDYNVIEPDQSIESAIRRLNRKLRFSDRDNGQ
ncbi:MAG: carboxypeptidase-like regulatory domain-containing protein [Marinilabiliaceae bacterium]|jgi:hypothetical protein|nr:carboxypeptidase-like regulatory domain-containing protein [Marinilabiliaceae bacterium]